MYYLWAHEKQRNLHIQNLITSGHFTLSSQFEKVFKIRLNQRCAYIYAIWLNEFSSHASLLKVIFLERVTDGDAAWLYKYIDSICRLDTSLLPSDVVKSNNKLCYTTNQKDIIERMHHKYTPSSHQVSIKKKRFFETQTLSLLIFMTGWWWNELKCSRPDQRLILK